MVAPKFSTMLNFSTTLDRDNTIPIQVYRKYQRGMHLLQPVANRGGQQGQPCYSLFLHTSSGHDTKHLDSSIDKKIQPSISFPQSFIEGSSGPNFRLCFSFVLRSMSERGHRKSAVGGRR